MSEADAPRTKNGKPLMSGFEACALAADILKSVGFVLHSVSMKSEACYYKFPRRNGVLRVSTHSSKHQMIGLDFVAARLTFNPKGCNDAPGMVIADAAAVEHRTAQAIGQFFIATSRPVPPPNYLGIKGTWTKPAPRAEGPGRFRAPQLGLAAPLDQDAQ